MVDEEEEEKRWNPFTTEDGERFIKIKVGSFTCKSNDEDWDESAASVDARSHLDVKTTFECFCEIESFPLHCKLLIWVFDFTIFLSSPKKKHTSQVNEWNA